MDQTAQAANVVNREPEGLKYGVGFGALICGVAKMVRSFRPLHTVATFALPAVIISYLVASRNVQIRDLTRCANDLKESVKLYCTSAEEAKSVIQKLQEGIDSFREEIESIKNKKQQKNELRKKEEEDRERVEKEEEVNRLKMELENLREALIVSQSNSRVK